MRLDYAVSLVSLLVTLVPTQASVDPQSNSLPRVDRIEPATAKPGVLVTGFGVNLRRSRVVDLILSRGDATALAHIVAQDENLIRFRIPRSLAAGQYRIVLVVSHPSSSGLMEQQTFINVLEEHTSSRPPVLGAHDPAYGL